MRRLVARATLSREQSYRTGVSIGVSINPDYGSLPILTSHGIRNGRAHLLQT